MNELELSQKSYSVQEQAQALHVMDAEGYARAGQFLLAVKGLQKEIDKAFDEIIKTANSTWKAAIAKKKGYEEPLLRAEALVKPKIAAYLRAEEDDRREKERALQNQARKMEEDRRLKEAESLEFQGRKQEAVASLDRPMPVTAVSVAPSYEKVKGISTTKKWGFRVTDESAVPKEYTIPDLIKIGQVVRALKDSTRISGVEIYCEDVVRAGV